MKIIILSKNFSSKKATFLANRYSTKKHTLVYWIVEKKNLHSDVSLSSSLLTSPKDASFFYYSRIFSEWRQTFPAPSNIDTLETSEIINSLKEKLEKEIKTEGIKFKVIQGRVSSREAKQDLTIPLPPSSERVKDDKKPGEGRVCGAEPPDFPAGESFVRAAGSDAAGAGGHEAIGNRNPYYLKAFGIFGGVAGAGAACGIAAVIMVSAGTVGVCLLISSIGLILIAASIYYKLIKTAHAPCPLSVDLNVKCNT